MDFDHTPISESKIDTYESIPFEASESHFQALLKEKIPLVNRIAHTNAYAEVSSDVLVAPTICDKLDISLGQLGGVLRAVGYEIDEVHVSTHIPATVFACVADEVYWKKQYATLDDHISVTKVANILGKSIDWVRASTNELNLFPKPIEGEALNTHGTYSQYFPKGVANSLRHVLLARMPAGNYLTATGMKAIIGKKPSWIVNELSKAGYEPEERWSPRGRLLDHYSSEALEYLKELVDTTKPAGDWLTAGRMAHILGRDVEWVMNRVTKIGKEFVQVRLDDSTRAVQHYHPKILNDLLGLSEADRSIPYATPDFVALSGLAKALGHDQKWVERRLPYTNIEPVLMLNPANNVVIKYYPKQVAMKALSEVVL